MPGGPRGPRGEAQRGPVRLGLVDGRGREAAAGRAGNGCKLQINRRLDQNIFRSANDALWQFLGLWRSLQNDWRAPKRANNSGLKVKSHRAAGWHQEDGQHRIKHTCTKGGDCLFCQILKQKKGTLFVKFEIFARRKLSSTLSCWTPNMTIVSCLWSVLGKM